MSEPDGKITVDDFVTLDVRVGQVLDVQPGTWVHMPANLKHSIKAKTPVVLLLLLLK